MNLEPLTAEQAEALAVLTNAASNARAVARDALQLDPLPGIEADPTPPHGIDRPALTRIAEAADALQTAREAVDPANRHTAGDPVTFDAATVVAVVRAITELFEAGYIVRLVAR